MSDQIYVEQTNEVYDALVIGTGVTGGWAAKEFCERGFKTLMVERGRVVQHRKDYTSEGKPPWQLEFRDQVEYSRIEHEFPVQSKCYAFKGSTWQYFSSDRDLPYSTQDGSEFVWIRANQLGGKSLVWARQSYRWSDHDFAANARDGRGIDWPIRYPDLAPWYSHVELHAGISGSRERLKQLPDSEFLPPFEMTKPELAVKAAIEARYPDRKVIIGRTANLSRRTELHMAQGRVACRARNECAKGCSYGAYFSTQSSTLPAAARTGKLHIAPNSVVHSLIYDGQSNRVVGVRVIDNETLAEREYRGKVVFLCASTLGSTQIMLNSRSGKFPDGIANSSGVLGHYLMDHNMNASAQGTIPGFEDEYYSGRRPTGIYIPNFQYEPARYKSEYVRGYAFGGGAVREDWRSTGQGFGFGVDFKSRLKQAGKWRFHLYAQGEMLPRFENRVSLHPDKKDKWGIPQLHVDCTWSDNERLMMRDAAASAREMLVNAGLEDVSSSFGEGPPGIAVHEMGTARMGNNPAESVLNAYNQCHDIPNLFVTDGSCFCSTAVQNPSLTFMALTVRAVDYAAKELAQKRI